MHTNAAKQLKGTGFGELRPGEGDKRRNGVWTVAGHAAQLVTVVVVSFVFFGGGVSFAVAIVGLLWWLSWGIITLND